MEMEIKKIFKKVSKNIGHIYPKMYFFHLLKVSHLGFETTFLHARLVYWLKWISSFQFIMRLRLFYFKVINLLQRFLHEMALFFKIRSSHFFFFSCNTKRKKKLEKALRTKVIFSKTYNLAPLPSKHFITCEKYQTFFVFLFLQ